VGDRSCTHIGVELPDQAGTVVVLEVVRQHIMRNGGGSQTMELFPARSPSSRPWTRTAAAAGPVATPRAGVVGPASAYVQDPGVGQGPRGACVEVGRAGERQGELAAQVSEGGARAHGRGSVRRQGRTGARSRRGPLASSRRWSRTSPRTARSSPEPRKNVAACAKHSRKRRRSPLM
jgi:hypothetical protein